MWFLIRDLFSLPFGTRIAIIQSPTLHTEKAKTDERMMPCATAAEQIRASKRTYIHYDRPTKYERSTEETREGQQKTTTRNTFQRKYYYDAWNKYEQTYKCIRTFEIHSLFHSLFRFALSLFVFIFSFVFVFRSFVRSFIGFHHYLLLRL